MHRNGSIKSRERYAECLSSIQIHLLRANAEAAHAKEAIAQGQQLLGELGAAPVGGGTTQGGGGRSSSVRAGSMRGLEGSTEWDGKSADLIPTQ